MATPEKKVKQKVCAKLKELGAYYFYASTGGYGASGVPDIVACYKGKLEEQERDHQELMALSDERLNKLEKQERAHPELEQQLWMQQEEHHR